jgi:hypothetical protein
MMSIGGRPASLAEDAVLPAEADDLPHREEIPAVVQLVDERELLQDQVPHLAGDAMGVALLGAL